MESDQALLVGFLAGDECTAAELYLRYAARVRNLARARRSSAVARLHSAEGLVSSLRQAMDGALRQGSSSVLPHG